ncbi:hypothetical protein ACIXBV_19300 [Bacteroides fragilis]|jgi:hypothetical protein|uniref:Uncharacterized protein n=1 Tax=Bacteroides fragilis TaxID=817 RepID=A0AB38PMT4_BACFG|nr:hypothetical protein [Bacteroides fragilis]KAB5389263.1 hypothetical protein F9Z90_17815 [Bacteroides fragilis]TWV39622.1 hypothetical protein FSA06_17445 [Bacteroides fragilis]TWV46806.1 hypothetical protein FSA03_18225 [Bacteroides fragilis]DAI93671.1 MAG TPA: hypothetical protein [Caudoviricetes sp.]
MKVINDSKIDTAQIGDIFVSVAVCNSNRYIIDEFDTMKEARTFVKEEGYIDAEYWYLAAETINEQGDLSPACWGKTKKEAVDKLKKALK